MKKRSKILTLKTILKSFQRNQSILDRGLERMFEKRLFKARQSSILEMKMRWRQNRNLKKQRSQRQTQQFKSSHSLPKNHANTTNGLIT